jgi:hypothetical protein
MTSSKLPIWLTDSYGFTIVPLGALYLVFSGNLENYVWGAGISWLFVAITGVVSVMVTVDATKKVTFLSEEEASLAANSFAIKTNGLISGIYIFFAFDTAYYADRSLAWVSSDGLTISIAIAVFTRWLFVTTAKIDKQ